MTKPTRGQIAHFLKLAGAAIPAVVAAIVKATGVEIPDSYAVVLSALTAVLGAAELIAHGGTTDPSTLRPPPSLPPATETPQTGYVPAELRK